MTIQLIRKDGKIRGIAIMRGEKSRIVAVADSDNRAEYWRICEHCTNHEALVFCRTHAQYVCAQCLEWHGRKSVGGRFILGYACVLISMSVARELADHAVQRVEIEAR